MTPEVLIRLLAEPVRMRVFAAVVLDATTSADVTRRTGLPARDVAGALRRLGDGGLVATADGALVARLDAFKEAVRGQPSRRADPLIDPANPDPLDPDRARAAVLRAFVADGRLVAIPAAHGKRRVILEHIATAFEPGVRYPEREVDALLRTWHPDHAALRRYLIDEGLLTRDAGVYWRIGGPTIY